MTSTCATACHDAGPPNCSSAPAQAQLESDSAFEDGAADNDQHYSGQQAASAAVSDATSLESLEQEDEAADPEANHAADQDATVQLAAQQAEAADPKAEHASGQPTTPIALPLQQAEAAVQEAAQAGQVVHAAQQADATVPEAGHAAGQQGSSAADRGQQALATPTVDQSTYEVAIEPASPAHNHPVHPESLDQDVKEEELLFTPSPKAPLADVDVVIPDSMDSLSNAVAVNQQTASSTAAKDHPTTPDFVEQVVKAAREKATAYPSGYSAEEQQARCGSEANPETTQRRRSHKRKSTAPQNCAHQRRRAQDSQASFLHWLLNGANPSTSVQAFWHTAGLGTADEAQNAEGSGTALQQVLCL